ncbi:MAG: energy transducer TonB [Hyphomicrobiales bacterium]|nr:MAG: energy transducer TonB [Hyphomicrobiales bacterium]
MADDAPQDILLRYIVASALSVALLAGGVYWLHRLPSGAPSQEAGSMIQVRLLPAPDQPPVPIPQTSSDRLHGNDPNTETLKPLRNAPDVASQDVEESEASVPLRSSIASSLPAVRVDPSSRPNVAPDIASSFQRELQRHIARFQNDPARLKQGLRDGTVRILFVLRRDGSILHAAVERSSGQKLLDEEALEVIRRAEPMPPIPPGLPERLRILLPVAFGP